MGPVTKSKLKNICLLFCYGFYVFSSDRRPDYFVKEASSERKEIKRSCSVVDVCYSL